MLKRLFEKLKHHMGSVLLLLALIFLAAGSYWLVQLVAQREAPQAASKNSLAPDYFVENFRFYRNAKISNANSNPNPNSAQAAQVMSIRGQRLNHLPSASSSEQASEIILPVLETTDKNRAKLTIKAQRAVVKNDGSQLELFQQVEVVRAAENGNPALSLFSEYLLVLPDEEIVKTPQAARMQQGTTLVNATGLEYHHATRTLDLQGRVKANLK